MKKWTALFLALLLTLPALALAEAAPAYEPLNFGDFNMAIDPDMAYTGGSEKKAGEPWLMLYPLYTEDNQDTTANFNIVWSEETVSVGDFTDSDKDAYIADLRQAVTAEYAAYGFTLSDFSVPYIGVEKMDGRDALVYIMVTDLTYEDTPISVYQLQAIVSDAAFGTYHFTGSAISMEQLNDVIAPLFDSITWNR